MSKVDLIKQNNAEIAKILTINIDHFSIKYQQINAFPIEWE